MSQNPIGRLMYGLMSFNYSFYHNVIERPLEAHGARIGEAYADARTAGSNKVVSRLAQAAPVARATGHIGASAAAVFAGGLLVSAVRERLLNPTKWQEHEDAGDTWSWLSDLAVQRSGVNGPLDPVAQAVAGIKYERDLSGLLAGAQVGYMLQAAGDMLAPFAGLSSPNTNTADYKAVKAAWNMFGAPAATMLLTAIPGGPLVEAGYGAALQAVTSRGAGDALATAAVGPKGTEVGGRAPSPPRAPEGPANSGTGWAGGIPLGVLDDVAAPAAKVALPLWERFPRVGKIGLGVAAGVKAVSALGHEFGRFKPGGE